METLVRKLAADLAAAIRDARKAGYSVEWPSRPEDLDRIAISETGRVAKEADPLAMVKGINQSLFKGFSEPSASPAVSGEGWVEDLPLENASVPALAPEPTFKKRGLKPSTDQ